MTDFVAQKYFINNELGFWYIDNEKKEMECKKILIDMIINLNIRRIQHEVDEDEINIEEIKKNLQELHNYSIRDLLDNINHLEYEYSHLKK